MDWLPPREATLRDQRGDIPDTQLGFSIQTADIDPAEDKNSVISDSMDQLGFGSNSSS